MADTGLVPGVYSLAGGGYENYRTPNTFKSGTATSGTLALWTPAAGKRFRLMGYAISVGQNASAASGGANFAIAFNDQAASIGIVPAFYLPPTAVTTVPGQCPAIVVNLAGNGYLSAAVNNVLNIVPNATLSTGLLSVMVWGTEE